jgi:hypothetical protein
MGFDQQVAWRFFDKAANALNLTEIPVANYMSTCRTNYFKVGRPKEFMEWLETVPDVIWEEKNPDNPDMVGMLYVENPDGAGWPSWRYPPNDTDELEDDIEFDIFEEIPQFLAPNEVAIFMEVGAEKLRYLHGQSIAVHSSGQMLEINLNDIYKLVNKEWPDSAPSECSY